MADAIQSVSATPSTLQRKSSPTSDKDLFLKLMVEQLRHQDPMNPTDGNEWLSQMAQFNSVEKLGAVADTSAQLASASSMTQAVSLLGKTVSYTEAGATVQGTVEKVDVGKDGPTLTVSGHA